MLTPRDKLLCHRLPTMFDHVSAGRTSAGIGADDCPPLTPHRQADRFLAMLAILAIPTNLMGK